MLELNLRNLSSTDLEEIVAYHCAQYGRVTSVKINDVSAIDGHWSAAVRMSSNEELNRVLKKIGDGKFGSTVVIRIVPEVQVVPALLRRPVHTASPPHAEAVQAATGNRKNSTGGRPAHPPTHRPIDILLVEDNPVDVRMTREALLAAGTPHHLHVVTDGQDAVEFLFREGKHAGAPRPNLILLDLNVPRLNGKEVLIEIKSNERLRDIPVAVLTSSSAETDRERCYAINADCFVTKPAGLAAYVAEIRMLESLARH